MEFENKLVAVINKKIEVGVAMNALAHVSVGLGSQAGSQMLRLDDYKDKDGNAYPNISQIPFIILRGTSGDIRKAVAQAREQDVQFGAFTDTMTGGGYKEQQDRTIHTAEPDLTYYAAVLCGNWETVTQITKKFSLYKG